MLTLLPVAVSIKECSVMGFEKVFIWFFYFSLFQANALPANFVAGFDLPDVACQTCPTANDSFASPLTPTASLCSGYDDPVDVKNVSPADVASYFVDDHKVLIK